MPLDKPAARQRIQSFDFSGLFTQELGWDWHNPTLLISVAGRDFTLRAVAEKRGFVAWHCPTPASETLPDSALRRRVEHEITKATHEHLVIFTDAAQTLQVWQWVRRESGKSLRFRETTWHKGQSGEPLIQKLDPLFVSLDEEENLTLLDVTSRVASNVAERVTKRFYEEFRKHHTAFLKFITGIPNQGDHEWYASIMLNRLMFLYFVQRKGFLDGDTNYLSNRLQKLKAEHGQDKFYSFYRYFLLKLFHGGLNKRLAERDPEMEKLLGRVPYLNGGIFDVHTLERTYSDAIQIPDSAFEAIFAYFNEWDWHLDERPLRSDKEINPDVLGYIFEKYINQKQMGAYYTKEDITEYIGKNTIIPFLFDSVQGKVKAAFEGEASVWSHLQTDPDRYIYKAVRHGVSWDYQPDHPEQGVPLKGERPLPADIAAGLDTSKPNLLERRKPWNKPAPATHGLPTEIWRETIARRQRCAEVREKLAAGKVLSINDFITLNLDLRRFIQDVIERCDSPDLLAAFWHALAGRPARKSNEKPQHGITILDPTCGSGAFLFAALNILEPVYEACLDRMEGLLADARTAGTKIHPESHLAEFANILKRVENHPNERYFIFKAIILHNLYGVDLMEEAVEICKLRLFLKLAAQVEPNSDDANLGIEPLPDIDFNIRAGNTLVGYATANEVRKCMTQFGDGQMRLGVEDELNSYARFVEKIELADRAYTLFRKLQTEDGMQAENFSAAKAELRERLASLANELNRYLASDYGKKINEASIKNPKSEFNLWLRSHQPFHWFVEFFGILNAGGFDVIVGNPPWKEYSAVKKGYTVRGYDTESSGNLYALCTERSIGMLSPRGFLSFIVQLPIVSSSRMVTTRALLRQGAAFVVTITCDDRPGKLFDGLQHCRSTIFTMQRHSGSPYALIWSSGYRRWATGVREFLFPITGFTKVGMGEIQQDQFPKLASPVQVSAYGKLFSRSNRSLGLQTSARPINNFVFYQESAQYWVKATVGLPYYAKNGHVGAPAHGRYLYFKDACHVQMACAILNSSLFYTYFIAYGDCFHLSDALATSFPVPPAALEDKRLEVLGAKLMRDLEHNAEKKTINTKDGDKIAYDEFRVSESKPIIDEIDAVLAEHYRFTEEELDFIVNYDIKYRLGRGNEEESE